MRDDHDGRPELVRPGRLEVKVPARRWHRLALVALVGVVFAPTLTHDLVWDDPFMVERAARASWTEIASAFANGFEISTEGGQTVFFRPVVTATTFLMARTWGDRPHWYHLANVLLHVVVMLLLYRIVESTFDDGLLAACSAAVFAVHPVVAEAVNFFSAMGDLLCATFLLGCLAVMNGAWKRPVLQIACFSLVYCLALLSKEPAAALPLFLTAALCLVKRETTRIHRSAAALSWGLVAMYMVWRAVAIGGPIAGPQSGVLAGGPGIVIASMFHYMRILLVPVDLSAVYVLVPASIVSVRTTVLVIAASVATLVVVDGRVPQPVRIGVLWLGCFSLPIVNLVLIPAGSPVADRYLYIPLAGFALVSGWLFRWVLRRNANMGVVVVCSLVVAMSFATFKRGRVWENELSLWKDTAQRATNHARTRFNLGRALSDHGDIVDAVREYEEALNLDPLMVEAHNNLASAWLQTGEVERAIQQLKEAVRISPADWRVYVTLGSAYRRQGKLSLGVESYRKAISLNPDSPEARNNLANGLLQMGHIELAIEQYEHALRLVPGHPVIVGNLENARTRLAGAEGRQ